MLYGYILLLISGITIKKFILFTLFGIVGGIIITSAIVMWGSLAFWIVRADSFAETINSMMTHVATYPEGIFNFAVKIILYTIIPVGVTVYIPVAVLTEFSLLKLVIPIGFMILMLVLAFTVFYRGLRVYSSSNLMMSKI